MKNKYDQNTISFSADWNGKLSSGGKYLTTIRPHNQKKYFVGKEISLQYNGNDIPANIRSIITRKYSEFSEHEISTDTGLSKEEAFEVFQKMYSKYEMNFDTQLWDYILLEKLSSPEKKQKSDDYPNRIKALDTVKVITKENPKIAFLDTETTGLDGEVIELSIIALDGTTLFDKRIKPVENTMDPKALATHGIQLEELEKENYLHIYRDQLAKIFSEYFILIYNSNFDLKIIQNSIEKNKRLPECPELNFEIRSECLMNLFALYRGIPSSKPYHKNGYTPIKLSQACDYMGIDTSNIQAHRALHDCWMSKEIFISLMEKTK